jgi:hypothetical protein
MSMTTHASSRTLEQRLAALDRANRVRMARAAFKCDMRTRRATVLDALADPPPEWARGMTILDLLLAIPAVGRTKAARILRTLGMSQFKTVGKLSDRQRCELLRILEARR